MKILMPIAQFQLNYGGAELQAHKLARALMRRGHDVELVSTRPHQTPSLGHEEGVRVRRLFSFGNLRGIWRLGPYSYTGLLLAELLGRRGQHDIVHVHQAFHPAFAAVEARRLGGAPVVVKIATAGEYGDLRQMREGRPTLPAGSHLMLGEILRRTDRIVAISTAVARELGETEVEPSRVTRIPNGVEVPPRVTEADRAEARASLGLRPGDRAAVYVGRGQPQKGADILLRAFAEVARQLPGARLFVAGDGFDGVSELHELARAAGPGVTMLGRTRDVPRYLKAADVFVLPSRGEGLSNAILEAMAHGTPVIASDLEANRDLIEPGRSGVLVPVGDTGEVARAMIDALRSPGSLASLADEARAKIEKTFAIDAVAGAYEALYEQLLRADRPAARAG